MPPDGDAELAADELQSLSFGSSERSRSASTISTAMASCSTSSSSGPIAGVPASRSSNPYTLAARLGTVQLCNIRFVQRLWAGHIGSVYLAEVKFKGGALVAAKVL
ncbi:hypothetical protein TRIUR3_34661 [Triticum urartu]|uniref:Protein kinase domain-containing protein n=1 Tax=Triticum urartu TaxID=4572 RepID=M7ZCS1_TRIUA|nr:hypothetical protein TRIUR3_34661 [Triticum urartu]